jgi:hypothetical protein
MPLPRLELETSGFDTMLGFMYQPDEPKSLSLYDISQQILHNLYDISQLGRGGQSTNTSQQEQLCTNS